ncbi:MAG TPA: RNA methyltransferase [Acidimicrobiales bacterium]|nr:RNA methyltransferase [Acidimicrobiales bacterium]
MTQGALGTRHQKVDRLRRLTRRRSVRASERVFVLEGAKLLSEALDAGAALEAVFVAPGATGVDDVVQRAFDAGARVHHLEPGVLERVGGTVTPQPVVALAPFCDVALTSVSEATLVVVCVDVRDPGNAGTVLRSAEAAGAGAVVFCDGSVDVFNPKTVRASAGSLFHVPVVNGGEPAAVLGHLATAGLRRVGTVARGGTAYDEADLTTPVALVLGNEAHGLPEGLSASLDEAVTIPMAGRAESLNVGMAAAIVCFEALRQRRRCTR